jgi:hypothetical protein
MTPSRRLVLLIACAFPLFASASPAQAFVRAHQKISSTEGNLTANLRDEDRFGVSIAPLGDLDGDGNEDIAVGAYIDRASNRGAVYVLFLNANGTVKSHVRISANEGGFTGTLDLYDEFGFSTANIGDLDNDGVVDIAVGARLDDDASTGENEGVDRGAVWILFLESDGTVKSHAKISDYWGSPGGSIGFLSDGDWFGWSCAGLGDVNGDGIEDIAVGATRTDDGGPDRGAVWVLHLATDGTVKSRQKISNTAGGFTGDLDDGDFFGAGVASVGDLDDDGVVDLAITTPSDDDGGFDRGAVWIVFRQPNGTVKAHQKISDTEGNFDGVLEDSDRFGVATSWSSGGCAQGILAIGATLDDDGGADQGAVWLLQLGHNGTVQGHSKISATEGGFTGDLDFEDAFGLGVSSLGDLNGDGSTDLAVGARTDDDGGTDRGAVWLLFLNDCDVSPTAIDMGDVPVFEFADADFMIKNEGCAPLTGEVTEACDQFSIVAGGGPYVLDPGESLVATVRFAPTVGGQYTCTVETGNLTCGSVLVTGNSTSSTAPTITSILDIGNDQGRNVRMTFQRSSLDRANSPTPIIQYEMFRRIDPLPAGESRETNATTMIHMRDAMRSEPAVLLEGWDFVAWAPAHGENEYNVPAPTLADSTLRDGMSWSVFFVRAATADPVVYFDSPPDSGYSLDNRPPAPPYGLTVAYRPAEGSNALAWFAPPDPDVYEFRVYRDTEDDFVPAPDKLVQVTTATQWVDVVQQPAQYHYLLTAVDWSGNQSEPVGPAVVTGTRPAIPERSALYQNTPNPFNPSTTIAYDVAAPGGHVVLEVFDVRGVLVRRLIDAPLTPGSRVAEWDGRDQKGLSVASGLYFCRLRVDQESFTRKMILVQ